MEVILKDKIQEIVKELKVFDSKEEKKKQVILKKKKRNARAAICFFVGCFHISFVTMFLSGLSILSTFAEFAVPEPGLSAQFGSI